MTDTTQPTATETAEDETARVTATLSPTELEALDKVIKYYRAPSRSHAIRLAIMDIAEMAQKKGNGTEILA